MIVRICDSPQEWDAFVDTHPEAANYHRWRWRAAIQESFGHQPYYLLAEEAGDVQGVLPLFEIRSLLFGHFLVSVPFFTYGGVLFRTDSARDALLANAVEIAEHLHARHIELRQPSGAGFGWQDLSPKVTMEVDLAADEEATFNRLNPKLRKRIRFAKKNGLTAQWFGAEALDDFYRIFATNMRNLGTPVYPRRWFDALCRCEPKEINILVLFDDRAPVASAFVSGYRSTLEMPWAATMPDSRKKFSPLLLYWSVLEWAHRHGYSKVDLGRCTRGSGNYEFKTHWATSERPLYWSYWVRAGAALPETRPENKKFHYMVELWKRLPLPVANGLGPMVVRSIP